MTKRDLWAFHSMAWKYVLYGAMWYCILIKGDAMGSQSSQFEGTIKGVEQLSTDHFSHRKPQLVVLHYTAGNDTSSQDWLTESHHSNVSAHYLIKSTGEIAQIVPESMRAWHGGVGSWRGFSDINSLSLGVEIVNWGFDGPHVPSPIDRSPCVRLSGSSHKWFPYAEDQFQSMAKLLVDFKERWHIKPAFFIGHSDIAPSRKVDPGPLFPWERLYREFGVGTWVDPLDQELGFVTLPTKANEVIIWTQRHLRIYGYGCPVTGELDSETQATIQAFQMHFRPLLIDGVPDEETRLILAHLVDQNCF